ncbi:MAG: hypothetical protein ACLUOF_08620 [Ruminococcus sp.]
MAGKFNMTPTKVPMPERDPKERAKCFEEVAMGYTQNRHRRRRLAVCCKVKPASADPVGVRSGFIATWLPGFSRHVTSSAQQPAGCRDVYVPGEPVRASASAKKGEPVAIGRLGVCGRLPVSMANRLNGKRLPNGKRVA